MASQIEKIRCYIIHQKDNICFAKNLELKALYRFIWDPKNIPVLDRGTNVYLSGEYEKCLKLYDGSGSTYGILKDDEKNWAIYPIQNFTIQLVNAPVPVLWHVSISLNSKWRCGDRIIVITGMKLNGKTQLDSKIEYILKQGKRKSTLSLRSLIANYHLLP